MFDVISKNYRKKFMIRAAVLCFIGLLLLATQYKKILHMNEPLPYLNHMEIETLDEKAVQADIDFILGRYTLRVTNTKIEDIFVAVVNDRVISIVVSDEHEIRKAEKIMEATGAYLDGNKAAFEGVTALHITAYVEGLEGDYQTRYQNYIDGLEVEETEKEALHVNYGLRSEPKLQENLKMGIGIVAIPAIFLVFVGFLCFVQGMTGDALKSLKENIEKDKNQELEISHIEKFCQETPDMNGFRVSEQYFVYIKDTKVFFAPSSEIVWVYAETAYKTYRLIPVWVTYKVFVAKANGQKFEIRMKSQTEVDQVMEYFYEQLPYIFIGHTKELQSFYYSNKKGMLSEVQKRKMQYL